MIKMIINFVFILNGYTVNHLILKEKSVGDTIIHKIVSLELLIVFRRINCVFSIYLIRFFKSVLV